MKSILLAFTLFLGSPLLYGQSDFYSKRWSEVYRYEVKALPKSALAVVDTIYGKAKREKNVEQFIKSLLYQSKFTLTLSENAELQIVEKIKKEISESTPPQRNILESILGTLYWEYFRENRWKYYERSRTQEKINETDFRTWDAAAVFREIDLHFQNSLQNAQLLQTLGLSTINDILTEAENSKVYRPTVYDFLAHNALGFYQTNESSITKPIDGFLLSDTAYFDDFENMMLTSTDSLSPHLQALRIIQRLLSFHKSAKDTSAYVNLEIERLQFITEEGVFENGPELHKKALRNLKPAYDHHPASSLIDFELAAILVKEGGDYQPGQKTENQFKKRDALILCDQVITRFPKSDGADRCRILKESILDSKIELTAERFIPINTHSRIRVTYTNTRQLAFSVFRVKKEYEHRFTNEMNDSLKRAELSRMNAHVDWQIELIDLNDYQEHHTEVAVPKLSQGRYMLVAHGDSLSPDKKEFAFAFIQVTDLAVMESVFHDVYRYRVVDRTTGKPIPDANVHLKTTTFLRNSYVNALDRNFTTNKDGYFEIKKPPRYSPNVQATVTFQKDTAIFGDYFISASYDPKPEKEDQYRAKSFLFTDRSIYRPGQTVYFKGILIRTKEKKSTVVPGEWVEVYLDDVNSEEIGMLRLKTNSFGSFSGEFKLPASGLTGEYTLYTDEDYEDDSKFYDNLSSFDSDELYISVEEYKRPTFEASFKPVKETFRINDTITVKGTALAFNGAKISGAKVSYHVKRTVQYPRWHFWDDNSRYSEEEEITFGESLTDIEGEFSFDFKAIPDATISRDDKPVFHYEVSVDITDISGETRSANTTVKVGYHTLLATINAPERIDNRIPENKMTVTTENLNGEFVATKGAVQIFKLQAPTSPMRARPWPSPDLPLITEKEFELLFPHDSYEDQSDPGKWPKGKLIQEYDFDTGKSKEIKFKTGPSWEPGMYVMELSTTDPNGVPVTDIFRFTVFDSRSKTVPDNQLLVFETDKSVYKVGEVARLKIGSSSPDITVIVDTERDQKTIKTYIEHLQNSTTEITIPVTDAMGAGFAVHGSAVNFNSFISETKHIVVTPESPQMEIETITFKDKIQPGSKETWSFEIKGDESVKKTAEILASMYDASLDQFKSHAWSFNPIERMGYYSHRYTSAGQSFGTRPFAISYSDYRFFSIPRQYYDQLDWFGFSITNNYYQKQRYMERLYSTGIDLDNPSEVKMINVKNRKDGYLYGTITTEDGQALPGVNVVIKGTTKGTITDHSGNYMIEADKGDVLVFSFIGFSTAEAKVSRKNTINVIMQEDVMALSEVVVTGMGVEMKKQALTSSVAEVVFESDTVAADVEFAFKLNGIVAGVEITGMDGGTAQLLIRGSSSIDGKNRPLYVVDGVLVESSKIDHEDLASVQVLQGAAATSLYGARAVNGVMIITTKSGQKKLDEELSKISTRKNFNETAFFFPHLTTDEAGRIRFTFTTPESLTRWKLQLLAHTKDLVTSTKTLQAVTQKELMVTPNAPRFLRVGDDITLVTKINNLKGKSKEGKIALQLSDAITGKSIDQVFQNVIRNQSFKIGARASTEISWKLKVPSGIDAIQYKVVAKAGNFSDGEQNIIPVLSNRILVTETLPMYIRSGETKSFSLEKLKTSTSSTLQHHRLTLEVTSNPAWYAIQALPYLIEFPYECSEQIFSRYYANTLASHIANSNPKIREVFDQWSSSDALISNLEKNTELKSILMEETPWLRDAQNESEQKKRIGLLFEINALKDQLQGAVYKLQSMQMANGGFSWFAGGRYASRYITQHIVSGFGHLNHLKVSVQDDHTADIITNAVRYLDGELYQDYHNLLMAANKIRSEASNPRNGEEKAKSYLAQKHIHNDHVQYLYMRSFFPDIELSEITNTAVEYYWKQSMEHWKDFNLYLKGMIALIHYRNGNARLSKEILRSLKENSILSDELGMYWKENKPGWYWHESPVETQALLIEAFSEIESGDTTLTQPDKQKTIDELRIWLLKNKQTSQWKTTKATTEAVYALLLNGTDWLPVDETVDVAIGNKNLVPDTKSAETGTGYYKTTWSGEAITPAMNEVTLTKKNEGIAWGGLYWQYFEDLDKVTAAETPLQLSKKVFVVSRTEQGELLTEVKPGIPLAVGDLLRIRIELKADRPMEFLHMKDMRASGLEPIDVLSSYKWQEGLGYYQSTKDAATNFFFDEMTPGVYVFEYDLRVNNKGNFSNGITTIQSMYAPEFSSHSEGIRILIE